MDGVLANSRIPVTLLPGQCVADAARDQGIDLVGLKPQQRDDRVLVRHKDVLSEVLGDALVRWWSKIPIWNRLDFDMEHQQQTNWCWAATSVSVSHFYHRLWSNWTQCKMVNAEKGLTTCCVDGSSTECNQPHVLDAPLSRANVLNHMVYGTVSYAEIQAEIDAGRPVAWRIGWAGQGGHFAVIEGHRVRGGQWVAIDDPWWGWSDTPLTTLTGGTYQGTGRWTHTYYTRRRAFSVVVDTEQVIEFPWIIWQQVQKLTKVTAPVGAAGGDQ